MITRFFLILWLLPAVALAEVRLLYWKPPGYDYTFVLPRRDKESPAKAVERYLRALSESPELGAFHRALPAPGAGQFPQVKQNEKPVALAVANDPGDMSPKARRMHRVLDPLVQRGSDAVLAPVAVTIGLDDGEVREFHALVQREFDGLVAVGGDDIHPSLYPGKPEGHSGPVKLYRDRHELELVRSYLEEGKGFFTGICRGHQLAAVASGCALIQDIETELATPHLPNTDHPVVLDEEAAGKLTRRLLNGLPEPLQVNSYHHQAMKEPTKPNSRVRSTAFAAGPGRIVEVAEYDGGRGLGVQFHPELMKDSEIQRRYYDLLFSEMDKAHSRRVSAPFRRMDLKKTLFGIEYTFQDQGMVDEPGRMTMETPHKRARFEEFKSAYIRAIGADQGAAGDYGRTNFKPGNTFEGADGKHVMNMEPVTIEVNTPPKIFDDILPAAEKLFPAAEKAALVPYVNPAAERSGMGHIHVGAQKIGDSPFYKNPLLLRNMMVYQHQHPSLLWGFAEAYDIGDKSNIETYHDPNREANFRKALNKFDAWYERTAAEGGDLSDGLRQFLRALNEFNAWETGFFEHYRFMNLEHMRSLAELSQPIDPELTGKYTVEFRNFRPPKSPQHARANAELLLSLMDQLSVPGHLEPFVSIPPAAYNRFHSATKVASDWEIVKRDLPRHNPLWDEMVGEYVGVQRGMEAVRAQLPGNIAAEIYPAYSRKGDKGTKFELRIAVESRPPPAFRLNGERLEFERVRENGKEYWVAVFDAKGELKPAVVRALSSGAECSKWFQAL